MTVDDFLRAIDDNSLRAVERAIAILWFEGRDDVAKGASAREICETFERIGHPKQNASRLHDALRKDRRTAKNELGGWKLRPSARHQLDAKFSPFIGTAKVAASTNTVLPRELFDGTRGYLQAVVRQLNISYDYGLYDCCAVMCRRLLETLLIEVYESKERATEIKGSDGNFLMFSPLLLHFDKDATLHPSRNASKGLRDFKLLGDLSAHNRRFNARKDDIDRIRDGLRVATGELLVMANLKSTI